MNTVLTEPGHTVYDGMKVTNEQWNRKENRISLSHSLRIHMVQHNAAQSLEQPNTVIANSKQKF
jgi:hypothetical protein